MRRPSSRLPHAALLRDGAAQWGVTLDEDALAGFAVYFDELTLWNQQFNLTAITDEREIVIKHFLDSLSCAIAIDLRAAGSLIDVGTGPGFPGLVLKVAFPHLRLLLLDAVEKRLRFLARVAARLGLAEVETRHARAEEAAREPALRERFEVATARAVARLDTLAEYCLPFVAVGGRFVAMKGPKVDDEVDQARRAIELLGGGKPTVHRLLLPTLDVGRSLVVVPKVSPTAPTYPRRPGTAKKHPL